MDTFMALYYGPYMRVWVPERVLDTSIKTCLNENCSKHKIYAHTSFCPTCGSKVDVFEYKKPSRMNLHEFFIEKFSDEDLFTVVYPDDTDYVLAVANRKGQGGFRFEDEADVEIIDENYASVADRSKFDDWDNKVATKTGKKVQKVSIILDNFIDKLSIMIDNFKYLFLQLINPKKVYCLDTGLINTVSFKFSENKMTIICYQVR